MKKRKSTKRIPFYLLVTGLGIFGVLVFVFIKSQLVTPLGINEIRTSSTFCSTPSFTDIGAIPVPNNLTYPSALKTTDGTYLMFVGGLTSKLPANLTRDAARRVFGSRQEEIWLMTSPDSTNWTPPLFSFAITPDTPVAFKNNQPYKTVYPNSFKKNCQIAQEKCSRNGDCTTQKVITQCNAQINDPTAVNLNGTLYLYFTILENYRWFSGSVDGIPTPLKNGEPTRPELQNIHSTGLAVSSDNGKSWAFVDKVIPENATDSTGQPILGAWAPSAIVTPDNNVDVYFHDAFGTKQYVAHLAGGANLTSITRLNPSDLTYRVNLDVISYQGNLLAAFNDDKFNIAMTRFSNPQDFARSCPTNIAIPSNAHATWPTPNLFINNNKLNLYFWHYQNPIYVQRFSSPL